MIKLLYNKGNDTIELHYSGHPEFTSYLRNNLKHDSRVWVPSSMCWVIVSEALDELLPIINEEFDDVEIKNLPKGVGKPKKFKGVTDLGRLYLREGAPDFLIKAAYKRLAKQYHPDGETPDEKEFQKIRDAYERLKK
jgi:hypothetical protein